MVLTEAMYFCTSFFDRGIERGVTAVRLKPTCFAAVFIHALLLSALMGFECNGAAGLSSSFEIVAVDCLEEEKVGVMKCGDPDLAMFSFPSIVDDSSA